MPPSFTDRALTYARSVDDGRIPACRQLKLAARRFLADLDAGVWTYDASKVERVCSFGELLPHTKAKWAANGELIRLEPWQIFILANIFGFVDDAGNRRFRQAFLLIPRKNGKSTVAAIIALYLAFADGEAGAEVYCGATTQKQAFEVFTPAKLMASRASGFARELGVTIGAQHLATADNSFFRPVIGKPGDGSSPHGWICDEYHEADDSSQLDTAITGMGAREQPLLLVITTAGTNTAGPCRELQQHAEAVLEGQLDEARLFAAIWTIDAADDWRDFEVWRKANPNLGVSVSEEYLRERHREALDRPAKASINLTKHCNVWKSSASAWLNMADWAGVGDAPALDTLAGRRAWLGLDLATKTDVCALVALVELPDGRHGYYPFLFLPELAVDASKNAAAYADWASTGELIVTEGQASDFQAVLDKVFELAQHLDVRAVAYDPWQAHYVGQLIAATGISSVEFPMKTETLSPPSIEFEADLLTRKLCHPNNRAFNWMAGNVVVREDPRGNIYPKKPANQDHLKIDGIAAAIMARGLCMDGANTKEIAPLFLPC